MMSSWCGSDNQQEETSSPTVAKVKVTKKSVPNWASSVSNPRDEMTNHHNDVLLLNWAEGPKNTTKEYKRKDKRAHNPRQLTREKEKVQLSEGQSES